VKKQRQDFLAEKYPDGKHQAEIIVELNLWIHGFVAMLNVFTKKDGEDYRMESLMFNEFNVL